MAGVVPVYNGAAGPGGEPARGNYSYRMVTCEWPKNMLLRCPDPEVRAGFALLLDHLVGLYPLEEVEVPVGAEVPLNELDADEEEDQTHSKNTHLYKRALNYVDQFVKQKQTNL